MIFQTRTGEEEKIAMDKLLSSELIFYSGIAVMAVSGVLAVLCAVVFRFTGKRLRHRLEQEYGKPRV